MIFISRLEDGRVTEARFSVVTDGACDVIGDLGPVVVPVHLAFGLEQYDSPGITTSDLYANLRSKAQHPTTSQPSPEEFAARYRALAGRAILGVHVSSGLSGTLNAADQGRKLAEANVHLMDSRSVSIGLGAQVYAAGMAARMGESLETAIKWVNRTREETRTIFALETLEYLRKSGRIGRAQAMIGGFLNIKPVLEVDRHTGGFEPLARVRGFSAATLEIVQRVRHWIPARTGLRVVLGYGEQESDADHLLELLKAHYAIHWVERVQVGPALAVHSGPRVVGLAVAAGLWPWER
jgi:DegV family protein with EDD domain